MWTDKEQAQIFGRLVKKARLAKGLTGAQLAAKALGTNANKSLISKIETGANLNPMPETVKALCDTLGITEETVAIILDGGDPETIADELDHLRKENGSLLASLEDFKQKTRAEREALATRFEIPQAFSLSDAKLITRLNEAADGFRAKVKSRKENAPSQFADLEAEIAAAEQDVDLKRIAAAREELSALKREIYEEAKGRVEAAQQTAQEALLEFVVEEEARASNALLRNRPEEAYKIFTSAAEALAGVDEIAAARRRNTYRQQLFEHNLRYGGKGHALAAEMIRPAIAAFAGTANKSDWASYTQNLANAVQEQGKRTAGEAGTKLLADAVASYRDALTVHTRDAHPTDWGMTTQNLAITLRNQGSRTSGEAGTLLLAEAVAAYRDALTVRTRTAEPVRWAMTIQNLAGALQEQGTRTKGVAGTTLLAEAVAAYRDALTVRTRDAEPAQWAMTTQNLAAALRNQGTRTAGNAGTKLLAEAVDAYRNALDVYTRDSHPVHWGTTTQNLAAALRNQGTRTAGEAGTKLLAEAAAAYRDAFIVRTRDAEPAKWAMTQENLAICERARALHPATTDPDPHWDAALAHVDAALEVYDPEHMSYDFETATVLRDLILARR